MDAPSIALLELGRTLARDGYHFITPTPETHRRVLARRSQAQDLRDVFGWSRPFARELLSAPVFALLEQAHALAVHDGLYTAGVRFSSLGDSLFVHSAYPTTQPDSVFFGPDTYRFCSWLQRAAPAARTVVDIGCGSGAGGLTAARSSGAERLVLVDINPAALRYAAINAQLAGRHAGSEIFASDVLAKVDGELDLIVANPPYMRDDGARVYRDGGGQFGEALSVRIVRESLHRLAPGGTLLLYTGVAIVDGVDMFAAQIAELLRPFTHDYVELDPDVFGEELDRPGYGQVERIAAVGLTVTKAA
jgi:SAM-dependent methyltransferase